MFPLQKPQSNIKSKKSQSYHEFVGKSIVKWMCLFLGVAHITNLTLYLVRALDASEYQGALLLWVFMFPGELQFYLQQLSCLQW